MRKSSNMTHKSESSRFSNTIMSFDEFGTSTRSNVNVVTLDSQSGIHFDHSPNRIIDHSFSQSESDDLANSCNKLKNIKIQDLQSDFVHLHSIKVHPDTSMQHLHPHDERKEGFQFRSLQASVKKSSKIVVVVPSIDLDRKELRRLCDSIEFYEERQLYHLLLANDPSVRVIYLSSNQVNEKVVGYYLNLCRDHTDNSSGNEMHDMLSRIMMIHLNTPFTKHCIPLSEKILRQPRLITFLKGLIGSSFSGCEDVNGGNVACGLSVFTGSDSIDTLSQKIGVRVLEASGDQLHYGTKQGSRECFAACGLAFPSGTPELPADEDLLSYGTDRGDMKNHRYIRSVHGLSIGIARQIAKGVKPSKWMIKLNQGFSGKGNASIDLRSIQSLSLSVSEIAALIEAALPNMKLEDPNLTWHDTLHHVGFKTQIERLGVIAESFVIGEFPSSPSVQAVIEPKDGRVSVISTHEQLLDGQVYNGCINPASDRYRAKIMDAGLAVGRFLATQGVVGHFSVDFIAYQNQDGSWDVNAVEVNLRQGGTTHPHSMMALLCGGCICSDGLFRTNDGSVRTYIATDTHFNSNLKGYDEERFVDALECKTDALANRIRWDKGNGVGVTFHLFKFIQRGRIGFTAIGRTREEAQSLFDATVEFLEDLGDKHSQG